MTLYIVATPIGNLQDVSFRMLETLKAVDLILCEDTRMTKRLLERYEILTPTLSYHQHSKLQKMELILGKLKEGKDLALVSDAGTPGISDPGNQLISYLLGHLEELKVIPIPGPSAVATAASVSGLPTDRFLFLGFPPHKKGRQKFFKAVADADLTVIFYESPHRIIKALEELAKLLTSERPVVVCRELTKMFESTYRGNINEVLKKVAGDKVKGEFVVMVGK